jgi:hypothetical protein
LKITITGRFSGAVGGRGEVVIFTVKQSQVELVHPNNPGRLVADASTLGLGVAEWPALIAVLDDADQGLLFTKERVELSPDGDVAGYVYSAESGEQLRVIND